MVDTSWGPSYKSVRGEEGGNDDDPYDPGGRTSRGITQREYNVFRKTHTGLPADVWQAPESAIEAIYKQGYWNPWCPQLPAGIDSMFFDTIVLQGPGRAIPELQQALGVKVDGRIGPVTLDAAQHADAASVVRKMTATRLSFFRRLRTWWRYGKGWTNRANNAQKVALSLVPK